MDDAQDLEQYFALDFAVTVKLEPHLQTLETSGFGTGFGFNARVFIRLSRCLALDSGVLMGLLCFAAHVWEQNFASFSCGRLITEEHAEHLTTVSGFSTHASL